MVALDLDDIPSVGRWFPWFRHNRRGLYAFYDSDHLPLPAEAVQHTPVPQDKGVSPPPTSTKATLARWLVDQRVILPSDARVILVTLPRMLGYVFNPVSFYFCSSAAAEPICAVAEVGNTFGERKLFLIPNHGLDSQKGVFQHTEPKAFYVSPFFDLGTAFDFKLAIPRQQLDIRIDDWFNGKRVLTTALTGRQRPFSAAELLWQTLRCPFVTAKIIALIHWNAALLWLKRVPWHAKADNPQNQSRVLNPHASLLSVARPTPSPPRANEPTSAP